LCCRDIGKVTGVDRYEAQGKLQGQALMLVEINNRFLLIDCDRHNVAR